MVELVIFDLDGTLAEVYTLRLLPRVQDFFRLVFQAGCPQPPRVAIATNQGGVGMRYWMEKAGFGKPEAYPTREEIEERVRRIVSALTGQDPDGISLPVYASYRYQSRQGKWAPVPPEEAGAPGWSMEWRKPQPGMLLQAIQDAGAHPERTLFVGDSEEDRRAAQGAGCAFAWAKDFFSREWDACQGLSQIEELVGKPAGGD
jgi:HAD superfamily hydrolase (TIGR01662 family)